MDISGTNEDLIRSNLQIKKMNLRESRTHARQAY